MHIAIDILAALALLLFCGKGWKKGLLLSALGGARAVTAIILAYVAGRYLGHWLGGAANRPRFVMIPMVAGLTFVIVNFIFQIVMAGIRARHAVLKKKENFKLPLISRASGGVLNGGIGLITLMLAFWMGDLLAAGLSGRPIPGADQSKFAGFTRRAVYEATYLVVPKEGHESQVATMARMLSNPAKGMKRMENVLSADSIQNLLTDPQFAQDLLSGDPALLRQNSSMQAFIQDKDTLVELREMGVLWEQENEASLCEKLSRFGQNEKIRASIDRLQAKELLSTDKLMLLIRDPDFDVIISELAK